jgi:hypothetical protein
MSLIAQYSYSCFNQLSSGKGNENIWEDYGECKLAVLLVPHKSFWPTMRNRNTPRSGINANGRLCCHDICHAVVLCDGWSNFSETVITVQGWGTIANVKIFNTQWDGREDSSSFDSHWNLRTNFGVHKSFWTRSFRLHVFLPYDMHPWSSFITDKSLLFTHTHHKPRTANQLTKLTDN